jgi:hypothetical protein
MTLNTAASGKNILALPCGARGSSPASRVGHYPAGQMMRGTRKSKRSRSRIVNGTVNGKEMTLNTAASGKNILRNARFQKPVISLPFTVPFTMRDAMPRIGDDLVDVVRALGVGPSPIRGIASRIVNGTVNGKEMTLNTAASGKNILRSRFHSLCVMLCLV